MMKYVAHCTSWAARGLKNRLISTSCSQRSTTASNRVRRRVNANLNTFEEETTNGLDELVQIKRFGEKGDATGQGHVPHTGAHEHNRNRDTTPPQFFTQLHAVDAGHADI